MGEGDEQMQYTFNFIVSASLDHFPSSTNWKFILLGRRSFVLLTPILASKKGFDSGSTSNTGCSISNASFFCLLMLTYNIQTQIPALRQESQTEKKKLIKRQIRKQHTFNVLRLMGLVTLITCPCSSISRP